MLFSALSKFLASLLVVVLTGAMFTFVLNQTVLNSKYLEHKLATTDSYNRLSVALNDEISKKATEGGNAPGVDVTGKLKTILTPQVLQTKIDSGLDQMQAFYRGDGAQPVIDLTDLAAQAQAAGIPIPEDSGITKPIKLGTSDQAKGFSKSFDMVRLSTLITAVVLTGALLFVSWERHKWAALPDVLIVVGVLLGLLAVLFNVVSGMSADYIKFDTSANPFEGIARDMASVIASDLAKRLGIVAAIYGVVGIGTRIWVARMNTTVAAKPMTQAKFKQNLKITN